VYGVGRDQGLTSSPTVAMLHAAAGRGFTIPYGGGSQLHFAEDAADVFVAASRTDYEGAIVADLGGPAVQMREVVEAIRRAAGSLEAPIEFEDKPLPFPAEVHDGDLESVLGPVRWTSLDEGVGRTVESFRALLREGLVALPEPAA
jgi:nucleoside-diphosphate-sugar epimerase